MVCKIWGFHAGYYEECSLVGYKNPVHTSQETDYFTDTGLRRLIQCKIWGSHAGYYEECRLLGYQNPVGTSQETHYVSTREPSRIMLCKMRFSRRWLWRMPSSGMLCRVTLVRTDISGERIGSSIKVTRIGDLETTLARCEDILCDPDDEAIRSSETSVLTRARRRNIPVGSIL
jgi:hypothetical protein